MQLLRALRCEPIGGYGKQPIPVAKDVAIAGLLSSFEEDMPELAALLQDQDRFTLDAFAERMAALAVRESSPAFLWPALKALDFAGYGLTSFELESMPVIFHAAELLGQPGLGDFPLSRLHGGVRTAAEDYRGGRGLRLDETRFREGSDADGFRFVDHLEPA